MRWLSVAVVVLFGCTPEPNPREAEVVQPIVRADEVLLRTRPALVAGKYARMAADPYSFFRGNLAAFRADWERGPYSRSGFLTHAEPVLGLGDPHPESFGVLVAGDGTAGFEPNDFDAAERVPYLFDLRRLLAGLELGVRLSGTDARPQRVAAEAARHYALAMLDAADGVPLERVDDPRKSLILDDLFRRSELDLASRAELSALTVVDGATRRFRRGAIDPEAPTRVLADAPELLATQARAALRRLGPQPDYAVLDVAREYGSGVASWPRLRLLLLVRGASDSVDDDLVLELKELSESPLAGWFAPAQSAADVPSRVEAAARRSWARPDADPRWYATEWLGLAVQVRTESHANPSLRLSRWTGARSSEEELVALAAVLGQLLARVHSCSEPVAVRTVANQIGRDIDAFIGEQVAFAHTATAQTLDDFVLFRAALERLGPTFGVIVDPVDQPSSTLAQLLSGQSRSPP